MDNNDSALSKFGKIVKTIGLGVIAGVCKMVDDSNKSAGVIDERARELYDKSYNAIRKTWDLPEVERKVDINEPVKLCKRRIMLKEEKLKKCRKAYEIAKQNNEYEKMERLEEIEKELEEECYQLKDELREIQHDIYKSVSSSQYDDSDNSD